jgi:tetratricopeptide (TPR) repeat protein
LAGDRPKESVDKLLKTFELNSNPKYAYTLAFFLHQNKDYDRAGLTLDFMIQNWPNYPDSYLLLADIRESQSKKDETIQLLHNALSTKGITERDRFRLEGRLRDLEGTHEGTR